MKKLQKKLSSVLRKRKCGVEQGSSMLEVTVALLVANIGLLGVAQLIAVATVMNKNSSNMVESSRAAQKIIEPLRAKDFSTLQIGTTTTKYNERYNVITAVTADGNTAKKISVTVEDTNYDSKGTTRSFTFVNYRSDDKAPIGSYYNSTLTVQSSTGTPATTSSPNGGYTTGS
jgi:Tfp pilus assembly protein PilV